MTDFSAKHTNLIEQLRFSNQLLDTIDSLVAVLDKKGRILSFNKACEKTSGYSFEEVKGRFVWEMLIPEDQVDAVCNVFRQLKAGDFPNKYVNHWKTKDGGRRLISWSNTCLLDPYGEVEYVVPTGVDVTESKKVEDDLRSSEAWVRLLLNSTAEAIFGVDVDGCCTFANPACVRMLGYQSEDDLIGKNMHALMHHSYPDGSAYPKEECNVRLSTKQGLSAHADNEVHWRADGSSFPVEYWSHPVFRDGELVGGVVTFVDITERKRAEEQLLKLKHAVEQTADAVMITNVDGLIEYVNPAFEKISGYVAAEIIGKYPGMFKSGKHSDGFYRQLWKQLVEGKVFSDVFINKRRDGSFYYDERTIAPIKNDKGEITHYVATGRDISDRVETEQQLKYLAHHDVLTELPNRVLFMDRLKQALARARWHNRTVAIMFLDLDRFKNINDTLGHEAGDQLLRLFAHRLTECLRDRDTVGRFGGDEFVVLLDDIAYVADVEVLAQKILDALTEAFVLEGTVFHVTASIGISLFPNDGEDTSTLLRNADLAMYRAKDEGRNSYEFYSSEMTVHAFERLNMENSLRIALERNEYVLHYQPQVNIHNGKIVGVEALLRWQHPELGLVSPDRFVPCLEDTGLIIPVGEWVLNTACKQLMQWREQGYSNLRMSVNISNRQFNSTGLVEQVKGLIQIYQFPPNILELEITESLMMSHAQSALQLFEAFNDMGVRLAVDDFGTGYSSLSYLRRLSIDTLKIDRSFIVDCPVNPDDAAIAEAIVNLAHTLRLDVVAEGVETGGQLEFLSVIGCEVAQGYLFAKPLPPEQVSLLLQTQPLKSDH